MEKIRNSFLIMFESFAELVFSSGWMLGALIILLTFCNPNIAAACFTSLFALMLFIVILGINFDDIAHGHYFFNPILVGMSIGAIFEFSPTLIIIICISTIMTFLLTLLLVRMFGAYGVPVLSLPFAIISTGFYLAAAGYNKLFSLALYDNKVFPALETYIPDIAVYFLKALGTIIFMPNVLAGAIIFLVIIYTSRILAIHAIIAFIAGVFIHSSLSASWVDAVSDPYSFNYILVGLALGGTFILPSLRSSLICILAVGVSVILVDVTAGFAETFKIPVFTLPFNCTVILFVSALRIIRYPEFNYDIRTSPELSLSSATAFKKRFKPNEVTISLPIKEQCTIYQGQNGDWTHKDKWKYAYDLVITGNNDSMHSGDGTKVEDYHIFDKEVVSSVSGYVVNCSDLLPDNPIGKLDHINNWGNYIIIKDLKGNYIEISHLKKDSLKVKINDYIEVGQAVANCGNSGYSPFPHIHIQAQKSYLLGDETVPFNFALYASNGEVKIQEKPAKDERIEYVEYNNELFDNFYFTIGAVYEYNVFINDQKSSKIQFKVKRSRDLSGLLFLEDDKGSKLYFSIMNGTFYIYDYIGKSSSYLKALYSAIPRFPLIKKEEFSFKEYLPLHIVTSGLTYACRSMLCWLIPWSKPPCGEWHYDHKNSLIGTIFEHKKQIKTKLIFDNNNGFKLIEAGNIKLISGDLDE
jgi:urea transporter